MVPLDSIRRSMLWSAYGDALGFITELASSSMVRSRVGTSRVEKLSSWTRRIGGKFGINKILPSGCYSDDTQLRLATCRAIRGDGTFDVEVFAKIELPVWRAYALGGGTNTKTAAQFLAKSNFHWNNNFYSTKSCRYINGGGNGAAMRIQPHVWAAPESKLQSLLVRDIIRNAVTTHGHPRGIIGAVFHGLCLRYALLSRKLPSPVEWNKMLHEMQSIRDVFRDDDELENFWVSAWEREAGQSLHEALATTLSELNDHIIECQRVLVKLEDKASLLDPLDYYIEIVKQFDCFSKENRGSGTKTALLASFLPLAFKDGLLCSLHAGVNLLNTDTDTIASMAGALIGAVALYDPPEPVLDIAYLGQQAQRLEMLSHRQKVESFNYPDLLYWRPPEADIDYVGVCDGSWSVLGLGKAHQIGDSSDQQGNATSIWQWLQLDFGQQILVKHRPNPKVVPRKMLPIVSHKAETDMNANKEDTSKNIAVPRHEQVVISKTANVSKLTLDEATDFVIQSHFDPYVVGAKLMQLIESENAIEQAVAFVAIIAKAKKARLKRDASRQGNPK